MAVEAGYHIVPEEPRMTRRKPLPGGRLPPAAAGLDSPQRRPGGEELYGLHGPGGFHLCRPGGALARFSGAELSDHNAIWAMCSLEE